MPANNYSWGFGNGNTLDAIAAQDFVRTHLTANNNLVQDPQLNNISRDENSTLDPRPNPSSPAATGAVQPNDPFFTVVPYHGAFDPNSFLWTEGWTALSVYGITDVNESFINNIPASFELSQNYPNPFNPSTKIKYTVAEGSNVKLAVYDILGREVDVLVNDFRSAGIYELNWNAENLPSGLYLYTFEAGNTRITKKMTLLK